jgi:hypothetical protein
LKSILYKAAVLLFLAAILVSIVVFGWSPYVEFASRRALYAVSQHAHEITSVEVLEITGKSESGSSGSYRLPYDHEHYAIIARHTLTGEQAAELVRKWNAVHFVQYYEVLCHNPGYVLRFLAGQRTIFEASVCFDCENITYSPVPFESVLVQMAPGKLAPNPGVDDLKKFLTMLP